MGPRAQIPRLVFNTTVTLALTCRASSGIGRRAEIASGDRLNGAPDLVIEIISPGAENERRDRVLKRRLYGRFGVKEYWLVDLINRSVEVYALGQDGLELKASYSGDDEMTSSLLPGFRARLTDLFKL